MDIQDLIEYFQAEAIANRLSPTEDYLWRSYCRQYSKTFNTPLPDVLRMEPGDVIQHLFEDQLDDVKVDDNLEHILDMIYALEDPEYAKTKRNEFKEFIKEAEEEEAQRVKAGKPIHKALADENEVTTQKTVLKKDPNTEKKLPQSGGINLSYLQREETGEES